MRVDLRHHGLAAASALAGLAGLAVAVALACGGGAPALRLSGTVVDAVTGEAIAGARVSDGRYGPAPRRSAVTDSLGRFACTTWAEEHDITVEAPGYGTLSLTLVPRRGAESVSLRLTPR